MNPDPRIEKLPRWAQAHIRTLECQKVESQNQLDTISSPTTKEPGTAAHELREYRQRIDPQMQLPIRPER